MKKLTLLFLFLGFLGLSNSFAQSGKLNKIRNAPLHAGEGRNFDIGYKKAIKFAREAVSEGGLIIESTEKVDDENYMIIGKAKTSAWSWGELVRVIVTNDSEDGEDEVTIKVYTRKNIKINVTAKGNYTQTILSNVEAKIEFDL